MIKSDKCGSHIIGGMNKSPKDYLVFRAMFCLGCDYFNKSKILSKRPPFEFCCVFGDCA